MENQIDVQRQERTDIQRRDERQFTELSRYEQLLRQAATLSKSTMIPKAYQGNPANTMIALEMAQRTGLSPLSVMQNLYIVNGNPSWSSQFIITMINNSRRYKTPLKWHTTGTGDTLTSYAYAIGQDDEEVIGPKITMEMAKEEGWVTKNGSKWKTMPGVMIQYRAAAFFGRQHCPDLLMGIYMSDEVIEMEQTPVEEAPNPFAKVAVNAE